MKNAPIQPARFAFNEQGLPCAPDFGDVYHAEAGAFAQARHVFLGGNQLPARWAGRERFVILETGFGLGNNFLATWAAWRDDPARCERLVFISVEKHPLRPEDLARAHAASPEPGLAHQLVAQWPLLTPNVHLLDFEGGRVQLMLAFGEVQPMLSELQAEVDACYLDGFAPACNAAMWLPDVFKRVARLTVPGATAATWCVARAVRDGLSQHGFEVQPAPGLASQREMTVARFAPRHVPPRPGAYRPAATGPREALIIGGGLAGCAAAWALQQQGWHSTVLDRQPEPAMETSGNPGGLMHGIFNAPDSLHARWFRTAALHTARWAAPALAAGHVPGQLTGLLRLDAALDTLAGLAAAQQQFSRVGLDPRYLSHLDPTAAAQQVGLPLPHGAWHYPQAGWMSPQAWARWLLAGSQARWLGQAQVAQLQRIGPRWQAIDPHGQVIAEAPVLVLAHALGARQLWPADLAALPLQAVRGQTTLLPGTTPGLRRPARPVSGHGYALTLPDGQVLVGATSQPDDDDPALRQADQQHNLQRAAELGVIDALPAQPASPLTGRVGWRAQAPDRLPLVGPPVDLAALAVARAGRHRLDAMRHQPRCHDAEQGVYVFTALGSRGITSAALGARVLAAWITGAPMPVEATLRDALDPARLATIRTTS